MKRAMVLGLLVGVGALSMSIAAFQQPAQQGGQQQGPPTVQVEKLKDNLYILRGGGGNTAVFVRSNGVTVVDTKNPGYGAPIMAEIKKITSQPITTIINTHTHGDHVSGNVEFPTGIEIVVQENTAANMKKMASPPGMGGGGAPQPSIFERNKGRGLPTRTYTDRLTLGTGADQVDLYYFGRGHTNGDTWVLFPSLRVVHAGDIFPNNNPLPLLDGNNGGSGVAIPDSLMKAHSGLSKMADTIITGHGANATFAELQKWADSNRSFLEMARAAKKQGQTAEQAAAAYKLPEGAQPARVLANIQNIYAELP
jgi:glyoxylase-like metal-dependent hydrolase (beta-lactamase superfamily II)